MGTFGTPKVSGARASDVAEINKLIAPQTTEPQCSSPQPSAPNFDAQSRFSVSEASVLCAPVHLSEMKDEPENLFCLAELRVVQNRLLRASCPEKPNHSSVNGFLGWVVCLNWVKHSKSWIGHETQGEKSWRIFQLSPNKKS
ncbi:hypothetical protein [Vibrio spartinae]|uniref:hypothetical protein n=1 Tax=Vibrio spartinae TaxID=1918945 RepID=UPI000942CEC8|nr:hypothetical protein [Vibrio spartinae]